MCAPLLRSRHYMLEWHVALQCFGCRERFARPVIHAWYTHVDRASRADSGRRGGHGDETAAPRENAIRFSRNSRKRCQERHPFIRSFAIYSTNGGEKREDFSPASYFPSTSKSTPYMESCKKLGIIAIFLKWYFFSIVTAYLWLVEM